MPRSGTEGARTAAYRAELLRDLHDAVTHRLTAMVVQADAAQTRLADRASTAASLAAIAASGREALAELRDILAGLRDPEPRPRAAPGLAELPELLDLAAPPGSRPQLTVRGEQHPLPPHTQAAMYRIVQEAVTNALRHTGAPPGSITVRYGPGHVELEIDSDPPPAPPGTPGLGTEGMRERVAGLGGMLTAGPRPDGGYRVLTWLPDA
jgi:signal transduction histidine kinase